jgi:hypothetical protein
MLLIDRRNIQSPQQSLLNFIFSAKQHQDIFLWLLRKHRSIHRIGFINSCKLNIQTYIVVIIKTMIYINSFIELRHPFASWQTFCFLYIYTYTSAKFWIKHIIFNNQDYDVSGCYFWEGNLVSVKFEYVWVSLTNNCHFKRTNTQYNATKYLPLHYIRYFKKIAVCLSIFIIHNTYT